MTGNLLVPVGQRFGFRARAIAGTMTAGICFWILDVQQERKAAEEVQRLGGTVYYAWRLDHQIQLTPQRGGVPRWLVPGDGFVDAVYIAGCDDELLDHKLACLRSFKHLRWISLAHVRITDATLEHLAGLSSLEWLDLKDTPITDAGLRHLHRVARLKSLDLGNTLVTDASLPQLAMLKRLKKLDLRGTRVTCRGLALLRNQLPEARIEADFDGDSFASSDIRWRDRRWPTAEFVRWPQV